MTIKTHRADEVQRGGAFLIAFLHQLDAECNEKGTITMVFFSLRYDLTFRQLRAVICLAIVTVATAEAGCSRSPAEGTPPPSGDSQKNPVSQLSSPDALLLLSSSAEMVDDLTYKQWQAFPKGTTVVRRTTTRSGKAPRPTISHTTLRLLDKTDEFLVIEEQTRTERSNGETVQNEPMTFRYPRRIPLPPNIRKEDWGKPQGIQKEGTDDVEVLGKTYRCRFFKYTSSTEAGEMLSTIWVSSDIPGGLVKSHSYVPNADETTTIDLIQITIPQSLPDRK